jgi:hypothetical protein
MSWLCVVTRSLNVVVDLLAGNDLTEGASHPERITTSKIEVIPGSRIVCGSWTLVAEMENVASRFGP